MDLNSIKFQVNKQNDTPSTSSVGARVALPAQKGKGDSVSFSGKNPDKDDKREKNLLKYLLGGLALMGLAALAFKEHKPVKLDEVDEFSRIPDIELPPVTDSFHGIGKGIDELQREGFAKFKEHFESVISTDTLDDLTGRLSIHIPEFNNPLANPVELVKKGFNNCHRNSNPEFFLDLFAFTKRAIPKDNMEAQQLRHSGLSALSEYTYDRTFATKLEDNLPAQSEFLKEHLAKEIGQILDEGAEGTIIPEKVRAQIVERFSVNNFPFSPHETLTRTLMDVADSTLTKIKTDEVMLDSLTQEGKNMLGVSELLHAEASRLMKTLGVKDELMTLDLGGIEKTIANYKKGTFKSGRDEFWDEYFKKKFGDFGNDFTSGSKKTSSASSSGAKASSSSASGAKYEKTHSQNASGAGANTKSSSNSSSKSQQNGNSNRKYTNKDKEDAAFEIFKKHGVDLSSADSQKPENLKKLYRRLATNLHPDHNGNSAEANAAMQEVNAAWDVLKAKYGVK